MGGDSGIVRLWNLTKPEPEYRDLVGHTSTIWSVAFSAEDQWIISGSKDSTAIIWDAAGNILDKLQGHTRTVGHGIFSTDGKRILTTSFDGTAKIWDWNGEKAREIHTLKGHRTQCWSGVFLPNDQQKVLTMPTAPRPDAARIVWRDPATQSWRYHVHR